MAHFLGDYLKTAKIEYIPEPGYPALGVTWEDGRLVILVIGEEFKKAPPIVKPGTPIVLLPVTINVVGLHPGSAHETDFADRRPYFKRGVYVSVMTEDPFHFITDWQPGASLGSNGTIVLATQMPKVRKAS